MDHDQRLELMRRFIVREVKACESADPEILTVFGHFPWDLFHPNPDNIIGVQISCLEDGLKVTTLVCAPIPDYEPTILQFWEETRSCKRFSCNVQHLADNKAVYFCPNALIVMRPTEEGDEALIKSFDCT
jgi:hypothetical protein